MLREPAVQRTVNLKPRTAINLPSPPDCAGSRGASRLTLVTQDCPPAAVSQRGRECANGGNTAA